MPTSVAFALEEADGEAPISLSGSVSLADDIVQDTLLRAWSKSDKFQPGTSLRAWLFTILRNNYYSNCRKRAREVRDSDGAYARRAHSVGRSGELSRPRGFSQGSRPAPHGTARSSDPRRGKRPVLEEEATICEVEIGTTGSATPVHGQAFPRASRARSRLSLWHIWIPPEHARIRVAAMIRSKRQRWRIKTLRTKSLAPDLPTKAVSWTTLAERPTLKGRSTAPHATEVNR